MKRRFILLAAIAIAATMSFSAAAQSRFTGHSFNSAGVFQMTISGAADLETSTNLQTWTRFASVSQETTLDDVASRQMELKYYRIRGGSPASSNIIGFVKVAIPGGKMAILANSFASPLRLDLPEKRQEVLGATNPPAKVSLYVNGGFVPHTLDTATGTWTPALRAIRSHEGFSVENPGTRNLTVRLSGELPQGQFKMSLPAGSSLVVPPVQRPGPIPDVLGIPAKNGMQIHLFDERTQQYQTSTFDDIDNAWLPKPPDYRPGRSFVLKTQEPVSWTKSFP